jgi:hypothetical protein
MNWQCLLREAPASSVRAPVIKKKYFSVCSGTCFSLRRDVTLTATHYLISLHKLLNRPVVRAAWRFVQNQQVTVPRRSLLCLVSRRRST